MRSRTKQILFSFLSLVILVAMPELSYGDKERSPKASIEIKGNDVYIEIKNLDLTGDETEKLKKMIEEKYRLNRLPKDSEISLSVKITEPMLKMAGIETKPLEKEGFSAKIKIDERSKFTMFSDLSVGAGEKYDNIAVIGGNLKFDGETDNLVVILGNCELGPNARINGDYAVILGGSNMAGTSQIRGQQFTLQTGRIAKNIIKLFIIPLAIFSLMALPPLLLLMRVAIWIIVFFLALLFLHVFPETARKSKEYMRTKMLPSLGFGVLGLLLIIPVFLFLLLSVIGIPIIPLYALALFVVLFGGYTISSVFVGNLIPVKYIRDHQTLALLVGMVVISIVMLIPMLGQILVFLVFTAGFGSVVATITKMLFGKK